MSELRGLRLVNGKRYCFRCKLEVLSDVGRQSLQYCYHRKDKRTVANAQTTMTAVVSSMTANKAIFLQATEEIQQL
jgi:hypothetical protein